MDAIFSRNTTWFGGLAIVGLLAVVNVITFVLYGVDKSAAQQGIRRVPENALHLWGLIGGWPGGLLAQRIFRHKTRKVSFQVTFWLTVALNCAGVALLASASSGMFQGGASSATAPPASKPDGNLPIIRPRSK